MRRRHRHHHGHGHRGRRRFRSRLQRRIFVWFGVSIFTTGVVVGVLTWALAPGGEWREKLERVRTFVGGRFDHVWDDPEARDELARAAADELTVGIVLVDASGATISTHGGGCPDEHHRFVAPVGPRDSRVGEVFICNTDGGPPRGGWIVALALVVAGLMLWGASGALARRLLRPLREVVRVAGDIGDGRLDSRIRMPRRHRDGEVEVLATAINDMAQRIEKQLSDQRELLAAVSHEIRTPLGHMRVLLELARDAEENNPERLDELEREVLAIESLVRQLLASSRLDFDTLERVDVDGSELGARALERAGLSADKLVLESEDAGLSGDPTLLASALANLIDNAERHGGGLRELKVTSDDAAVTFEVSDDGNGFTPSERERVFDSFFRGHERAGGSLGLGLALVRRIAHAHGGRAWADDAEGGGARVSLRVARS